MDVYWYVCMHVLMFSSSSFFSSALTFFSGFAAEENKAMNDVLLSAIHEIARTGNVWYVWMYVHMTHKE